MATREEATPAIASSHAVDEVGRSAPPDESKAKTWFEPAINTAGRSPESAIGFKAMYLCGR